MQTTQARLGKAQADQAQAMAQLRMVESALSFVNRGLDDPYAPRRLQSLQTLELLVRNKLLEAATGGGLVPNGRQMAQTWRKGAWDVALELACRSMLEAFASARLRFFGRIAPPWMGLGDDVREAALAEEICGCAPTEEPVHAEPLKQAYAMAQFNVLRCEQRITLLYMLADLARRGNGELANAAAEAELDIVSRQLWTSRSLHLSRMLAMGTLLGGEFQEQNKQLVKAMYGEGMSVIELLQVDGYLPGRWQCSTEDALRQAMAQA